MNDENFKTLELERVKCAMVERPKLVEELIAEAKLPDSVGEFKLHTELRWYAPSLEIVRACVNAYPNRISDLNENGMTALHVYSMNLVNEDILKYLIQQYPEALKLPNKFGFLPIHKAAMCKHCDGDTLKALIDANPAGLLVKNREGSTPLHLAIAGRQPQLQTVGMLLRTQPKAAKVKDRHGRVPMHLLAAGYVPPESEKADRMRIFDLLLEAFPDACKIADIDGNLPLHYQAMKDKPSNEILNLLLFANAEACTVRNNKGYDPRDLCVILKGKERISTVSSALLNYKSVKEKVSEMEADVDSDDEEALLAMLALVEGPLGAVPSSMMDESK